MAVNFNGGFVVGGEKHPLSSEEIRFLLTILKSCSFQGDELENLMVIVMKLQEEYNKVLKIEKNTK
tara:strand:- start:1255 stop:1452 length:198 start_codon:yes stop_codon:yes gene_type:complete